MYVVDRLETGDLSEKPPTTSKWSFRPQILFQEMLSKLQVVLQGFSTKPFSPTANIASLPSFYLLFFKKLPMSSLVLHQT